MIKKSQFIVDKLFKKLQNYKARKINLEKDEFKKFISYLISNS